jgi:hypothetical protein
VQLLEEALRGAAEAVSVPAPDELGGGVLRWGSQLDVQQLATEDEERRRRASYLAKYSTKSTEQAGGLLHRIHRNEVDAAPVREHVRRYLRTAVELHDRVSAASGADEAGEEASKRWRAPATWRDPNGLVLRVLEAMSADERIAVRLHDRTEHVGRVVRCTASGLLLDTGDEIGMADVCALMMTAAPESLKRDKRDRRLAACAHTFGYRGHCLTKSRRYSTTFKALREARQAHVHEQILARSRDATQRALAEAEERTVKLEVDGIGHVTASDQFYALAEHSRARERHRIGREEHCDRPSRAIRARRRATGERPAREDASDGEAVHDE